MGIVLDILTIMLSLMIFRSMVRFFLRLSQSLGKTKAENTKHNENLHGYKEEQDNSTRKEYQPIEMIRDPICGKYIQKDKAFQVVTSQHQIEYFCSWDCREKHIEANNAL